jgi:membrane protease YdiL (CAAX protease family)
MTTLTLAVVVLRHGRRISDYLALRRASWRITVPWLLSGVVAVFLTTSTRFAILPFRLADSGFLMQEGLIVYAATLVVLIPFSEELFVRGFLLAGLRETPLRDFAAIPLSAIIWASLHEYSEWQGLAAVFLLGCLLGMMRRDCRSILPGYCVHAFSNALALALQVAQGLGVV